MTQDQPQRLAAEPGCPPEWLEEIVETIDGTIIDMTTTDQVQWWCAGELYTRLQRAKRKIEDLEANGMDERARSSTSSTTHSTL